MNKKTFLLVVVTIVGFYFSSTAQYVDRSSFKAGVNAGIPVGDYSEALSFSLGLDLSYNWGVSELLDVGIASGFINAFGKTESVTVGDFTVEGDFGDYQIVPMAAAFRIYPTYDFKFGADVGYGVGINEGNDGGFYVRPIIGYNITGNTELNVSYVNVSNNGNFSLVSAGILFLF